MATYAFPSLRAARHAARCRIMSNPTLSGSIALVSINIGHAHEGMAGASGIGVTLEPGGFGYGLSARRATAMLGAEITPPRAARHSGPDLNVSSILYGQNVSGRSTGTPKPTYRSSQNSDYVRVAITHGRTAMVARPADFH